MSRIVFPLELLTNTQRSALADERETCIILFGRSVSVDGKLGRIVIRQKLEVPAEAYAVRTKTSAQLRPEFVAEATARARRNDESIVFLHTHPFGWDRFSKVDDSGEQLLVDFLKQRLPTRIHAAIVVSPSNMRARVIGSRQALHVFGIGRRLIGFDENTSIPIDQKYDRQVRLFGEEGQRIIRSLRVGIVGLGGTGSVVLQQLAHLGVRDFLLIDPDTIEDSNLNRVVGSTVQDVGKLKVDVAERLARQVDRTVLIEARAESVLRESTALRLTDTDVTFCCTDSQGSRAVLNALAYQYLVPVIDMGVVIAVNKNQIANIAGRTQLLAPGLPCLTCANLLDAEQVRRDLMTDFERQADPYITGDVQPAPAVISLNSTMASLATTMFLNVAVGVPGNARLINYDAISGTTRSAVAPVHAGCIVCSDRGALARADEWRLPARQD